MAFSDGSGTITGRSYNSLIFSEGAPPPSMRYIPSPTLTTGFKYPFGGRETNVVIPKGRIVALATDETVKNPETGMQVYPMTLANGSNIPLGVAFTNVYELDYDAPFDMAYGIITNDTIEVPWVTTKDEADAVQWACAWGSAFKPGDVVMPDDMGHFTKWTILTDADGNAAYEPAEGISENFAMLEQRVGRVYEVDTNIPPEGWLKWAELPKAGDFTDPSLPISYDYSDRDSYGGYPYDTAYRAGFRKYGPQGIYGLTDGAKIEVTYTAQKVGVLNDATQEYRVRLRHYPITNVTSVTIGEATLDTSEWTIDKNTGLLTIVANAVEQAAVGDVAVTYTATHQTPGVPSGWDIKGLLGVLRIKLIL